VFERFTDRARRVLVLAQEEARVLNHSYIGTEHILLGLIHEGEGVAAKALERSGVTLEAVRNEVDQITGTGSNGPSGSPPFTPRAKKVLEFSLRESIELGHDYIGTEHMMLGVIREGEGVAAQALRNLGIDLEQLREEVIDIQSGSYGDVGGSQVRRVVGTDPPRCPKCRAGLSEQARYRLIAVPPQDPESGEADLSIPVVYCNRCGTALGSFEGSRNPRPTGS
jgi:ATP-dependent Clp protease ATP-binding subunit ClpC